MACNFPWLRLIRGTSSRLGYDHFMPTPCNHCRGCIKDYIQAWSDRCTFEAQTQDRPSAFVTLTYNDDYLPVNKFVSHDDVTKFMKRFRYYLSKGDKQRKLRFYIASEYGLEDFRPHYHCQIFGFDPQNSFDMNALYLAWSSKKNPIGFFSADYLNPGRVRYCFKYVSKEKNPDYYDDILKRGLEPLFHTMSNGIGFDWFCQNVEHIVRNRGYIVNGVLRPLNRYYMDLFHLIQEESPYVSIRKVQDRLSQKGIAWHPWDFTRQGQDETKFANYIRESAMAHKEYYLNET